MSSFTTGGASDLDKLIALATFLSSPEYLERAKSLRDIIDESEKRTAEAKDAVAEAAEAIKAAQLVADRHAEEKKAFEAERAQHNHDLSIREAALDARVERLVFDRRQLAVDRKTHNDATSAFSRTKTKTEEDLAGREAAVKVSEANLQRAESAHRKRVAALNRAMSDED